MELYHLSNTRVGAIIHSLLYLLGIPIFRDYNNLEEPIKNEEGIIGEFGFTNQTPFPSELFLEEPKCFESYGCFTPKYPDLRGFHLYPDSIEEMNPSVCYYSAKSHGGGDDKWCQIVDPETIKKLSPSPGANGTRSYWITHGYMENGNRPWIKEMVKQLLEFDPFCGVFVLDWSEGAKPPYNQAVVNIELVAVFAAKIMAQLQEFYGLEFKNIHVIGHSVGSHLGGFIGSWIKNNLNAVIGRISGMDPAQYYFQNFPPDARLDVSDALFVDIIHTDARPLMDGGTVGVGLGIQQAIGHADFFPNGGKDQPGCKDGVYNAIAQEDGSFLYGIRRFLGCDHMRSYEYFTESIRSQCEFLSYSCDSWEQFSSAMCLNFTTNRMGFHAYNPSDGVTNDTYLLPVNYYLITGPASPFCRSHLIVTINLAKGSTYRSNSDLHLVLTTENGDKSILTIDWDELEGGNLTYTFLRDCQLKSPITKVILRPATTNPILWFVNRMSPKTPDLTIKTISVFSLQQSGHDKVETFCPEGKSWFSFSDQNPSVSLIKC